MEEQKREEMNESGNVENTQEVMEAPGTGSEAADVQNNSSDNQAEAPAGMPTRSYILWVLAGMYLAYTGYKLCKNVIDGVEGASMGFMVGGVIFLVLGVGLLFLGARGVYRSDRLKKAMEISAEGKRSHEPEPQPQPEEIVSRTASAPAADEANKRMSIAERARLAKRLEDEVAEEDAAEDETAEDKAAE